MVYAWTHGIDMESWYRHGLMVRKWTHVIDMNLWYRHKLMVLPTPMVLTQAQGTPESHTNERAECFPYAGYIYFLSC